MSRAGRFFTWAELTRSGTAERLGLSNAPTAGILLALQRLVDQTLDPLRAVLGRPIRVASGYRSPAVNAAVGGSEGSQHTRGEAADITVEGMASEEVVRALVGSGIPFDQVIWYAPERGGHAHISYTDRRPLRRQTLHAPASGGYVPWRP